MKIRRIGTTDEKIELQMTPMIDIVFQLLIFFIMTFKIVSMEGDFNIRMPLKSQVASTPQATPLFVHIQLRADAQGQLLSPGGIIVNGELRFDRMEDLHNYVIGIVGVDEPGGSGEAEAELECDPNLNYEYVIEAITAVSGYVDHSTGQVQRLIERVNFTPPPDVTGP